MDVHRLQLIEEVQKRPNLWLKICKQNKPWNDIGKILNANAYSCKRTWQIMRNRFWLESKRISIRIAKARENGNYHPDEKYTKWHLYETLKFLEKTNAGHRKNDSASNNSDVESVKQECIGNKNLPNESQIDDSEQDSKDFEADNLNSSDSEFETISNDSTAYRENSFCKQEPELQIEADSHLTENKNIDTFQENNSSTPQLSQHFEGANPVKDEIKYEYADQSAPSEEHYVSSPDLSDENYCFLYSFLSQTKLMSQAQKMEFRIQMKNLLLHIFPASSSVDILENNLLLAVDNDPDKRFLLSFWPFMKSMSLSQNVQFRSKMADLILNSIRD